MQKNKLDRNDILLRVYDLRNQGYDVHISDSMSDEELIFNYEIANTIRRKIHEDEYEKKKQNLALMAVYMLYFIAQKYPE